MKGIDRKSLGMLPLLQQRQTAQKVGSPNLQPPTVEQPGTTRSRNISVAALLHHPLQHLLPEVAGTAVVQGKIPP